MFGRGLPGAVLGGLLGSWLLLAGSSFGSKLRSPKLNIKEKQHVIQAGDSLNLMCSGEVAHSWSLPESLTKDSKRLNITTYTCGRNRGQFCSSLTLNKAQANDTGYYSCKYPSSSAVRKKIVSTIYIFINDTRSPFVEVHSNIPKTIHMTEGQELIIPCRVTAPDIPVTLRMIPGEVPKGKTIWDNTKGFIIPNATFEFIGLFRCEAIIGEHKYKSMYLTYRQNNDIINVNLNASRPVKLLKGDHLVLNCTVTASWNTRVLITWAYPGERSKRGTITSSINQRNYGANVFYSILVVDKVRDIDKGPYTCKVTSGPSLRLVNATVHVYDKAFISLKHRRKNVLEVVSGKKSYRISMKVKAFPTPEVVWLKDGLPAAGMCARYRIKSYSLTIKYVAEEDAGNYTILLSTRQWNLHKNLTVTLRVNVKPQIYEKMSSFPGPALYQVGSKQTLTCTVYGIPQPKVKWTWHPCQQNHSRSRRDFCSNPERPFTLKSGSTTGNRIQSITQRSAIIEGKNKTASILIVDESKVSGIYTCIASNKLGTDERSIRYFVTDVPSGFHINLEKMPIEGDNLVLSCLANKFLYKDIAWILPRTVNNQTRVKKAATKEYSIDLTLTIKNISLEHSGIYACRARDIYTGEEVLQKKDVTVRAQEAPFLLRNLTDQVVNTSHSVTLECLVHGLPEPQISWFKNNKKILHQPGIIFRPGSQNLLIERVQEDDEGHYRCVATNLKGAVESSAFVTVQGATGLGSSPSTADHHGYPPETIFMTLIANPHACLSCVCIPNNISHNKRRCNDYFTGQEVKGISESSNLELITLTCTCVAATLFWLLLTLFIRKLKRPHSSEVKTDYLSIIMDPEEVPLDEQCERLPYDASKWEFARERLKLGKTLGRGAFGKVVQAAAFGIKKSPTYKVVAVKMLKEGATASEYKALMTELKILIHIGHHLNVVNLLGACTKSGGPLMVIVEYCKYGNLSSYLKSKRIFFSTNKDASIQVELLAEEKDVEPMGGKKWRLESIPSSESLASSGFLEDKSLSDVEEEEEDADDFYKWPLTMQDLISYSFQVARGMEFLSSQKCIHRDLAARNILLSENNVVKICDFGLARDIYKNPDYVRKGDARLPLKWMAPESIFDKIYSTKSDVWSYGVLLWEIFSLGASPYPGIQIDEDFFSKLKEGVRMKAPDFATTEIYQIMLDCWQTDPNERPRFSELVKRLGDLLQANVQQNGKDYIPLNILSVDSGYDCSTSYIPQRKEDESAPPLNYGHTENSGRYVNVFKMKPPQRVKTFEGLSSKERSGLDGYQADSGLVLPSERLKRFTWTGSKQKQTLFGLLSASKSKDSVFTDSIKQNLYSFSCGHISDVTRPLPWGSTMWEKKVVQAFPPPTYNSVVLHSTPPV